MSRKNGYVNMKDKERNITTVSEENIYLLNGRVPLGKRFLSAYSMYWPCS